MGETKKITVPAFVAKALDFLKKNYPDVMGLPNYMRVQLAQNGYREAADWIRDNRRIYVMAVAQGWTAAKDDTKSDTETPKAEIPQKRGSKKTRTSN